MTKVKIRTALISVSDKAGLTSLGETLSKFDVHVLSTGGTFKSLSETDVNLEEVSSYTGFPEIMDGRVKTLHPRVHGGLLGRLEADGNGVDAAIMAAHGIKPIDLVVVNLYPFEQTVAAPGVALADAIENIDIGGPAMLRSAAKNFIRVAVVVDPADYESVAGELTENDGCLSLATRFELAVKAFRHVAHYDVAIADFLARLDGTTIQQEDIE